MSAIVLAAVSLPGAEQRPNVLFLFADDMRADTIAALGNAHIQTPNLDRLVITNLAEEPKHAAKVAELMALLVRKQKEFGDTAPLIIEDPKPAAWSPPSADKNTKKPAKPAP